MRGFYHPNYDYCEYDNDVEQKWIDALPEGTKEVPPKPHDADYEWDDPNSVWVKVVQPILSADVNAERDRRIALGFTFNGVLFQSRPEDLENIAGASTSALGAKVAGSPVGDYRWHGGASDFVWIAADNTEIAMDAHDVFALGKAAMAHKQDHIFASKALKDLTPIPEDYREDIHWPTAV